MGRSRTTEDIDVFIKKMNFNKFNDLYKELKKNNFWCLNSGKNKEIYCYLLDGYSVRFAIKNQTAPNLEIKFAKKPLDKESFKDRINVITKLGKLKISSLERQIAFKRYYLKSDKDIEDAEHLENLFKENINKEKINKYRILIELKSTTNG